MSDRPPEQLKTTVQVVPEIAWRGVAVPHSPSYVSERPQTADGESVGMELSFELVGDEDEVRVQDR